MAAQARAVQHMIMSQGPAREGSTGLPVDVLAERRRTTRGAVYETFATRDGIWRPSA